jgi:CheY-like chemotaxis protein
LALCKGLIELHGGDIRVYSAGLGQGSEFVISLPLDGTHCENQLLLFEEEVQVPHCNRRILIIDDNFDLAMSLSELLQLYEHEVAVAHNGYEGLKIAREFKPEILLCDIGLPDMDGYEVARAFQADEELKDVFLVALTGYAQSADQQKASDAGFAKHLAKPVLLDALERLLAEIPVKLG